MPPCSYSYNAFGLGEASARSNPPDFFFGGATTRDWTLSPATVSIWSYEAMYADEVKASGYLDNDRRRALILQFFQAIEADCGKNLIFYYANYSNPLSNDETPRYVLIGVSRIIKVGDEIFYNNVKDEVAKKYANGMVWARDVTAAFPDEGVRLPYHRYINDPDKLAEIALFPENPFQFKYGSKHVSDDEAIGLLEQFLSKVRTLAEFGDTTEDWPAREAWLLKVIAELWTHRGLFPGLLKVLKAVDAAPLIAGTKELCIRDGHQVAHAAAFELLELGAENAVSAGIAADDRKRIARNWQLLDDGQRMLFRDVLPRMDLTIDVMQAVASELRLNVGIDASAEQIAENPYLLTEMFRGDDADNRIAWSTVDRGVLPSPDVGGTPLAGMQFNDARRFRALCVEHLRREPNHTFRFGRELIIEIGERMERLPSWKQAQFTDRYFKVDAEFLSDALTLKPVSEGLSVYLKSIYEDERKVEATFRQLASRPDLELRRPVSVADWSSWIQKPESPLAAKGGEFYKEATDEQSDTCQRLFRKPLSVVTGPAGTGKTMVIEALIRAVRRSEGDGASVLVLAPTGKATDRAREVFEKASLTQVRTVTVHSFLAAGGWLNDNLTFKRQGGKRAGVGTLVLDEASMLDLELAAALFRSIDWAQVRRLILVGDAGQLPPIGRGRVFADLLKWLAADYPDALGRLQRNLRQLLNKVQAQGSSIVALSELFILDEEDKAGGGRDGATRADQESLIARIHAGGKIDEDLEVIYWDDPLRLSETLLKAVEDKMRSEHNVDGEKPYQVWRQALDGDPTAYQILTPHRGEMHGVEALNEACQKRISKDVIGRVGAVDGVTLFDKVIQVRNRPRSNLIWGYDWGVREQVKVEVFNGEIGTVTVMGCDKKIWNTLKTGYGPRLRRFAVRFTRKTSIDVGYGNDVPHGGGGYKKNENVGENLELAYAVSVHKAQGSEFAHTFVIIPSCQKRPVSAELVYTALTRASRHCTLLLERDVTSLLDARRRENAQTPQINSSLFELHIVKAALRDRRSWYEAGKIHESLSGDMLRSKSEVIIANLLHDREIPFLYEQPLFASDGTLRLPDFTVTWAGQTYFWEHLGRLDLSDYAAEWELKKSWYKKWFPGQLITTEEGPHISKSAAEIIDRLSQGNLVA